MRFSRYVDSDGTVNEATWVVSVSLASSIEPSGFCSGQSTSSRPPHVKLSTRSSAMTSPHRISTIQSDIGITPVALRAQNKHPSSSCTVSQALMDRRRSFSCCRTSRVEPSSFRCIRISLCSWRRCRLFCRGDTSLLEQGEC